MADSTAPRVLQLIRKLVAQSLLAGIRLYQITLSPLLGSNCRFVPSCSSYAEQAIRRFGPGRGSWLAVRRVLRCHPWSPEGHDPVPPAEPSDPLEIDSGASTFHG